MIQIISTLFLALAAPQTSVVDSAAHMAEVFWSQFSEVHCTEKVVQNRLGPNGKVTATRSSSFDYVALLEEAGGGYSVEESRVAQKSAPVDQKQQFLLTSGFPSLLLIFHKDFRDRFVFELGESDVAHPGTVRVNFKSRPDARSISGLKLKERIYPILWKGSAWVEPATGAVRRIEASLAAPMDDIGLADLRVEVDYAPAQFDGAGKDYWLPSKATISVKSLHQEWRNVHDFSQYKQFEVSTTTGVSASK